MQGLEQHGLVGVLRTAAAIKIHNVLEDDDLTTLTMMMRTRLEWDRIEGKRGIRPGWAGGGFDNTVTATPRDVGEG
jgi:hypothetical protein